MNIYALISFVASLIYITLGLIGLKIDRRAHLNRIFFLLCLACAWWAICIAFMFPADDYQTAWRLFRLSSPGFCLGPALILHFTIHLIADSPTRIKRWLALLIYIPGLIFTVMGVTHGITSHHLMLKSFGWDNIAANTTVGYWTYALYYSLCVGISIILVARWGIRSKSRRQKNQAYTLTIFSLLGLVTASLSEVLPPLLGFAQIPKIPAVMWLFWAYGTWYTIAKYRLLVVTPQIATSAIVSSITDMLVMLDVEGRITIVNKALENLLEYTADELLGQPVNLIMGDRTYVTNTLAAMRNRQCSQDRVSLDFIGRGEKAIPVSLFCSAINDTFGELVGAVMVAQDLRPQKLLESQNTELEAISHDLLETNLVLGRKSTQLKNILDNVGQGFFTFGPDLLIQPEYSHECSVILGTSLDNKTLADLIYPLDDDEKQFIIDLLHRIFQESDRDKTDLYLSLLPDEFDINGRFISIECKLVAGQETADNSGYIITILTDITETRLLEEKMQEEQNTLRMVVKAIAYYDQFVDCIEDFRLFYQDSLPQILRSQVSIEEKYNEIMRSIHTFKGNFSQYDMLYLVKQLHQLENELTTLHNDYRNKNELQEKLLEADFRGWLNHDLAIVDRFLGDDYLQKRDTFTVNKEKLQEIQSEMLRLLPPREYALLSPYISKLRYKPFKDLLKAYPEYVLQLAARLGKNVNPFVIAGSDVLVDADQFHFFIRSLTNVFRNMVDHGIEYVDERIIKGKNEVGNIRCQVEEAGDRILLIMADDGAGLDLDRIKQAAVASGQYSEQEAAAFTDEQITQLIFADSISTRDDITDISGRGMGLSSVKEELDRLGGTVNINTTVGIGTTFIFSLPNSQDLTLPEFTNDEIVLAVVQTLKEFNFKYLKAKLYTDSPVQALDKAMLDRYTAMINIHGMLDGTVIISYSERLLADLAAVLWEEAVDPCDQTQIEDATAEITNMVLGNSFKKLGQLEDLLTVGIPAVVAHKAATIRHSHKLIYTCTLAKDDYVVTVCFIPNQ